jgi:hypothetical protein
MCNWTQPRAWWRSFNLGPGSLPHLCLPHQLNRIAGRGVEFDSVLSSLGNAGERDASSTPGRRHVLNNGWASIGNNGPCMQPQLAHGP